jgi:hypothetical protein
MAGGDRIGWRRDGRDGACATQDASRSDGYVFRTKTNAHAKEERQRQLGWVGRTGVRPDPSGLVWAFASACGSTVQGGFRFS